MPQPNVNFPSQLVGEARELRSLARCLVRNDDAEDVAQDAFVTALSQPKKPRSLRPWLRQVVRNQSRARARSEHRRRTREQSSPIPEPLGTPDEEASHAQIVAAVNEALLELDAPYRDVLRARFFADRTAAEIANSEGCPAGTVRWRVQEGLRRVRRKLDERFDGRRQWLGGMAFIAGVPLLPPMAAPPPGNSTMTKLMILKVLAAAAVVTAGAAAVNVADADTTKTEQAGVTQEQVGTATHSAAAAVLAPTAKADALQMSIARATASEHAAADVAGEASDDAPCPTCSLGTQRDPLPSAGSKEVGDDLTDCFENVDTDPGEMIALRITVGETPTGEGMAVADAAFVEDRFNQVEGLAECVAAALDGFVTDTVPDAGTELTISVVLDGDRPDGAKLPPVDDGVQNPAVVAKNLGASPRGTKGAPISIVECTDYDCPFCKKARGTLDRIIADYGDRVAVYELQNPLAFHPGAEPAAKAVIAAGLQDKLWEMSDLAFDHQDRRTEADFVAFAEELELDVAKFRGDFGSEAVTATLEEHKRTCNGNGARGTPSFFINSDFIVGAQPYEKFKTIIEDELAEATK